MLDDRNSTVSTKQIDGVGVWNRTLNLFGWTVPFSATGVVVTTSLSTLHQPEPPTCQTFHKSTSTAEVLKSSATKQSLMYLSRFGSRNKRRREGRRRKAASANCRSRLPWHGSKKMARSPHDGGHLSAA